MQRRSINVGSNSESIDTVGTVSFKIESPAVRKTKSGGFKRAFGGPSKNSTPTAVPTPTVSDSLTLAFQDDLDYWNAQYDPNKPTRSI